MERVGLAPSMAPARLLAGAIGGLAGGVLFGAMMATAGMLGMIALLVGGGGDAVAWPVHLAISASFGVLFAVGVAPGPLPKSVALGAAWGVVLWVVAAMLVMRTVLGAPIQLDTMAVRSLAGHVAYGAVLGLAYPTIVPALRPLVQARSGPAKPGSAEEP